MDLLKDATAAAKKKLYEVALDALNCFYTAHRPEINAELAQRGVEQYEAAVKSAEDTVTNLREKLQAAEAELNKLKPGSCPAHRVGFD